MKIFSLDLRPLRARMYRIHHRQSGKNGYERLSQLWVCVEGNVDTQMARRVIILEDDLEVAPDFLEYFAAMAPLLDRDDSIMAAAERQRHARICRKFKDRRSL